MKRELSAPRALGPVSLRKVFARALGWKALALLGLFVVIPSAGRAQEEALKMLDGSAVEIACNVSRDEWQSIMTMGPIDADGEETSLSKDIKVTLKYLFLQGSKRQRITLLVKWTQNARVALEVNSRQLCDSQGTTGVRTTVSGQTQTATDGKAVLPPGYIRILPEEIK